MTTSGMSRRGFLAATGVAAAATVLPGLVGQPLGASAAEARTNLAKLVDLRFGMFNHFNLGTFTDEEWAAGGQSPSLFAPSSVDCAQWAAAAAAAKMSYGVLTTKHHDGFALWPTAFGKQNVAYSGYRRDVVRQYVNAFRARGLKVGLYYSIWDRTHTIQALGGHVSDQTQTIEPGDMTVVLGQIRELLTNYGAIDMLVTDGWSWQMGQQQIPYQEVHNLVKSLQPNCVIIDIGGLSQPWLSDAIFFEAPLGVRAPEGNTYAGVQGETISNGWFWHPSTPTTNPRARDAILADLKDLEPKYTSYLLNCPPNRDGRLDANIVTRLAEVGAAWSPNHSRPPLPAQPLRVEWPVNPVTAYASSFNSGEFAYHAIDNRSDVRFESCWSTWGGGRTLPQTITIDLGGVWSNVSTLEYLPKQWHRDSTNTNGDITAATISTSTNGVDFTKVAAVDWAAGQQFKLAEWAGRDVGFVRIHVTAATGGYVNISGIHLGGRLARPRLVSRFPLAHTVYRIQARHSGKVLHVQNSATADGTPVQQWSRQDNAGQKWTFISTGDGYFRIRDQNSGKLLEVGGLARGNGGKMNIRGGASLHQQHWAVTPVGEGFFILTNRLSQRVLNVPDASTADGTVLDQWDYHHAPQQQWQLIPS
ncbi:alpha-L-fucosidase [Crossiella sp. SN42]|uniref:alpha-L-fucosidase n=1 Tax=Crossiella sp. SN42 TaxID=2944808 RepID=UPI00207D00B4|nr:alpha-L-fucosidase [Crossiella sp. SN42]MCO1574321.1 alpha-L-fucosidase [Crossiella sp. SN42]